MSQLTLPVTVASEERSFSKLKLIKSYLWSTMSQERLNGLAILCIEKNMLENIDFEDIIDDFASQNARRSRLFQWLFVFLMLLLRLLICRWCNGSQTAFCVQLGHLITKPSWRATWELCFVLLKF